MGCPFELDSYVKKLVNAKQRVTVVSNILQTTQERLNKVHDAVEKDTAKRKALLDHSPIYSIEVKTEQKDADTSAVDQEAHQKNQDPDSKDSPGETSEQ
ncbi:hypothetical protein G9C98_006339 [Cotesia typhae]|uniref:Uncharacterized protein n=1 Tax=Cotesia typhae TaxID=2053667 RepID=A0A8J5V8K5_9HYME|nr:hypothetical protein G9C98_006339 [Cotesia typhae]